MADAEEAPLVIVKGMAGTAKTFYTLAVGLHAMLEQEEPAYRRILISRPNAQFDDDIGFLPGDESEKIAPLLRPVVDNLELLVDRTKRNGFPTNAAFPEKWKSCSTGVLWTPRPSISSAAGQFPKPIWSLTRRRT